MANQDTSVALVGATSMSQIEDNIKAVELLKRWNQTLEDKVAKILNNQPESELDFNTWSPSTPRRQEALFKKSD